MADKAVAVSNCPTNFLYFVLHYVIMNKEHVIHVRMDDMEYDDLMRVTGGRKVSTFIRDCIRMGIYYHVMTGKVDWDGNQKSVHNRSVDEGDGTD